MKPVPTADNIIEKHYNMDKDEDGNKILYPWSVKYAMIEFAKLHVKAALKAASENVMQYGENVSRIPVYNVDKESILNAYPETLIK